MHLKLLISILRARQLDSEASEQEKRGEHEGDLNCRQFELKEAISVHLDAVIFEVLPVDEAENIGHVVPEEDGREKWHIKVEHPLLECASSPVQCTVDNPEKQHH